MEPTAHQHRLLAILCADGAGYSALMAADDRAALQALDAARDVFRSSIQAERGRLIDMAGDSVLAVFESVAAAVQAALAVQRALAAPWSEGRARLAFRIGIHLGDVIEKADGSVYGDGVNIAARLQTLASPGGIVVSQAVHGAVVGRVDARFRDLGEHAVKNIPRKVHAFAAETGTESDAPRRVAPRRSRPRRARRFLTVAGIAACVVAVVFGVRWFRGTGTTAALSPATATVRDAVVGKAVAVLPFDSVGGDKETEGIADGISDELIATLSGVPGLRLSARTSSFFFKGKQAPTSEIASRLGVSYLVTGTVRRGAARLRIGVQLVHAADGLLLWSRTYDREPDDVLAMQADIARSVAANLQVRISQSELAGSGTSDAEALRLYWQGRQQLSARGDEVTALALARQALVRDPGFVRARLLAIEAELGITRFTYGDRNDPRLRQLVAEAGELAKLLPGMFDAQATYGAVLRAAWRIPESVAARQRAVESGSGSAAAALLRVNLHSEAGRMAEAIDTLGEAMALDPLSDRALSTGAFLLLQAGRPGPALDYADRALELVPGARYTLALRSAALARLGRGKEAMAAADKLEGGPAYTFFGMSALALTGHREPLEAALRRVELDARHSFGHAFLLIQLGRHGEALDELDVNQVPPGDYFLRTQYEPAWDPVRNDPRFIAVLEKLGVKEAHDRAQAWRKANPPQGASAPGR